jgi:LysM domain-containing protein
MVSLSTHLRQVDRHAALPFRADCPRCRAERLAGELPTARLVSPRVPALLTAGMLIASSAAPGVALAVEPDQQYEGTEAPQSTGPDDAAQGPDFDPGGAGNQLPVETQAAEPAAGDAVSDDAAPVDSEPATDTAEVVVDAGDGADAAAPTRQTTTPTTEAAPAPPGPAQPAAPAADPAPTSGAPAPVSAPPTSAGPQVIVGPHRTVDAKPRRRSRSVLSRLRRRGDVRRAERAIAEPEPPTAASASVEAAPAARTFDRGGKHIVRPGDSLWSIASGVLGPRSSNAEIARFVSRLWELNKQRIGTGNPSLVLVGTELRLP